MFQFFRFDSRNLHGQIKGHRCENRKTPPNSSKLTCKWAAQLMVYTFGHGRWCESRFKRRAKVSCLQWIFEINRSSYKCPALNRLVKFGRSWIDAICGDILTRTNATSLLPLRFDNLQPRAREVKDAIKSSLMRKKHKNEKWQKIKLQRWINIRISHYPSILQMFIATSNYQFCCVI